MQLRYFKEVARQENISRAAETLHITQSALSKSIAKLEDEVGLQLFERQGNRIHLNHFGKIMLRYADRITLDLRSCQSELRELAGLESGPIRVGLSGDVFIKHLVKDFLLEHPGVSMTCLLQSNEQMAASLEDGTIDFTVSTDPIEGTDLIWEPVYTDQLTVLIGQNHPLAQRESLYLKELSNERFIISNMGYGMRSSTYDLCRQVGFEPQVLYEGYDTEMAGDLVARGQAVMITPHSISLGVSRFLADSPRKPAVGIPLVDFFTHKNIGITSKRGHFKSAAVKEFYSCVVDYFTSL